MKRTLIILSLMLFTGCSLYQIDIRQGNFMKQEMLDQLEWGMPAKKVRFIMGTPMIVDVFHKNRWDYVYSFQQGGKNERQQRHIALFFDDNNRLIKIKGDVKVRPRRTQKRRPSRPRLDQEPIL